MIAAARNTKVEKAPSDLTGRVKVLLQDYSADEIKAAVIKNWADRNNVQVQELSSGFVSNRYLSSFTQRSSTSLSLLGGRGDDFADLSQVEDAFEATFTEDHRREHGVVYTPPFIAKYLIREGIAMASSSRKKNFSFCDPCCGGAAFQIAAAEVLFEEQQINYEDAFQNHIWGFDRDSVTLANAQCLIELFLASKHRPLPRKSLNLHQCDFFIADPKQFLNSIGLPDGFDVIATNPPYVKLQNLPEEYRSALALKYNGLANGSFSLAMLFPIAAQHFLNMKGCLAVITQNNFFTSLAGTEVRRELQRQHGVRRIIDFGHNKVFDNASAYTCLLFLTRSRSEAIEFDSIREKITQESLARTRFSRIPFATLKPDKWRLACEKDLAALQRIEKEGVPLGDLAPIRVGFATLKDRVFLVENFGGKTLARNLQEVTQEIEGGITRPAIKIAAFDSEAELLNNRLRVICPYQQSTGKAVLMSEDQLKSQFPKTYDYLLECQEFLATRDKGKKNYEAWFAWGRTQGMSAPGPKLLTKTFSRGPNFLLDESDSLFCNGYAVFQPQPSLFGSAISMRALQRILNSSVMYFYARLTSFQLEGGYECYQKNFIERFGIPQISSAEDAELVQMSQTEANVWIAHRYGLDPNYLNDFLGVSNLDLESDTEQRAYPEDHEQNHLVTA
jgi:adenine-specific DNA-methyltransferase